MTYARRVEATHTKTEDTPRHEKRRQDRQRPKENEPPPVCSYSAAPVSISTTEQTNRKPQHTKTAARLWKAARPWPFFWRVEAFRPLRRYIVSPAPKRGQYRQHTKEDAPPC